MSISVSRVSVSSQTATGASAATGAVTIEALQKKLVALQKDLKDALGEGSKEGQAKAKLIQVQILATQAQLEQLIRQKTEAQAQKQVLQNSGAASFTPRQRPDKPTLIDTYV